MLVGSVPSASSSSGTWKASQCPCRISSVSLRHSWADSSCLASCFGVVFLAFFFALASALGIDIAHLPDTGAQLPLSFQVSFAALAIAMDFALTFVTPALAYTTRSVILAWDIGLSMIRQTW